MTAAKRHYPLAVLTAALEQFWGDRLPSPALLRRMHEHSQVDGRYLALPIYAYPGLKTWGEANRAWIEIAEKTGGQALCRAATRAGISAQDIHPPLLGPATAGSRASLHAPRS